MSDKRKAFLICHRGALGDFILCWPSVILLKKNFPEHVFVGLGRPDYMKLAIKLGVLDDWFDAESAVMLDFFEAGKVPKELGNLDKGALWLKDARKTADLLKMNSGCELTPLDPFPSEKIPVAKFHINQISMLFKIKDPPEPIDLIPGSYFPAKNTILIHPGSGSEKKNYSVEFYINTAKFAADHFKNDVNFILGPVEMEKGIGSLFPVESLLIPENTSDLADLLGGCKLYIGNDSGVSHLSGFLGTPTIALYKDTDPEIWGVVGRKTTCLKNPTEDAALKNLKDFLLSGNIF